MLPRRKLTCALKRNYVLITKGIRCVVVWRLNPGCLLGYHVLSTLHHRTEHRGFLCQRGAVCYLPLRSVSSIYLMILGILYLCIMTKGTSIMQASNDVMMNTGAVP